MALRLPRMSTQPLTPEDDDDMLSLLRTGMSDKGTTTALPVTQTNKTTAPTAPSSYQNPRELPMRNEPAPAPEPSTSGPPIPSWEPNGTYKSGDYQNPRELPMRNEPEPAPAPAPQPSTVVEDYYPPASASVLLPEPAPQERDDIIRDVFSDFIPDQPTEPEVPLQKQETAADIADAQDDLDATMPPPAGEESPGKDDITLDHMRDLLTDYMPDDGGDNPPLSRTDPILTDRFQHPAPTDEGTTETDWQRMYEDAISEHDARLGPMMDLANEDAARLQRRAAANAARMGMPVGGGGYGAAMSQAALEGERLKMQTQLQHQQQNMDMRMNFLGQLHEQAMQDKDLEMQKWAEEQMDETLLRSTWIDAMLSATPETIEALAASGQLPGLNPGWMGGAGGGGPDGSSNMFPDAKYDAYRDTMRSWSATSGASPVATQELADALLSGDKGKVFAWWDANDVSKDQVIALARSMNVDEDFIDELVDKTEITMSDVFIDPFKWSVGQ